MALTKVSDSGDRLKTLRELRHKLADTIEKSNSGRDIASLSIQLQKVMLEISELEEKEAVEKDDTVLDIVRRKHGRQVRGDKRQRLETEDEE